MDQVPPTENSSLLPPNQAIVDSDFGTETHDKGVLSYAIAVLPIALLSALAMAATAATAIHAYASLTCEEATHCKENEKNTYAGVVAIAMTIANLCALLALGIMAKVSKRSHKLGLAAWIVCRSVGVAVLALGGELS